MSSSIYTHRVRPIVASLLLTLAGVAMAEDAPDANATAQADQAAQKVAATICASCHGVTGTSKSPLFPRLAGQQEAYLNAQLKAFKGKTRGEQDAHDYMWGMATLLDDAVIDGLSRYYAAQKPAPGIPGDPALVARGKVLYEQGEPTRQVAACSACHGENAAGLSIFPRLAGQHAAYVVRQLDAIQHKFRDSPVMHGVIKELDPADMKAVAAYVQSR